MSKNFKMLVYMLGAAVALRLVMEKAKSDALKSLATIR
jgi:hypothetical protein